MARPGDPKIGPADPDTAHRELMKRLQEEADYRKKHPLDMKGTASNVVGDGDHLPAPRPHPELRKGPDGKTVMETVDQAQRGVISRFDH